MSEEGGGGGGGVLAGIGWGRGVAGKRDGTSVYLSHVSRAIKESVRQKQAEQRLFEEERRNHAKTRRCHNARHTENSGTHQDTKSVTRSLYTGRAPPHRGQR